MSDSIDLSRENNIGVDLANSAVLAEPKSNVPSYDVLQAQLDEASVLVDDIVLKNYLTNLTDLEIIPLDESLKNIGDIRLFKINEMVYQNDEYSTYKFASVFNSVQNLNCGVFIIADSNGKKTDFYMGVRSFDAKRTTESLKDTLLNALCGQFPGVKTVSLLDEVVEGKPIPKGYHDVTAKDFLANIESRDVAVVSCVAKNKDEEFKDNEKFIQGLEKLALAMQGQRYTAVVLAKSAPTEQLAETRRAYEQIYTQLSPFANIQLSYGTNTALSISSAFSRGSSRGTAHSVNTSSQTGSNYSYSQNESTTRDNTASRVLGVIGIVAGAAATIATGGAAIGFAAGSVAAGLGAALTKKTTTSGEAKTWTDNKSETYGEADTTNESTNENFTKTDGLTSSTSDNMQLTMQNKALISTLERIDLQLKRIDECESLGMWECAAYFLSDEQATAEMAAGTYKALMKGEKSGVETSAINFWGRQNAKQLPLLREYITNFIHPVFEYRSNSVTVPVTASSLISGNELAIQMGLPRKSVCGFPVIEHADFGKEVVKYNQSASDCDNEIILGKVFSMGSESNTEVCLDRESFAMHTFITGSTGSGKSNTVYQILEKLRNSGVSFMVIEPAKGEYKNVLGHDEDVSVLGTNPQYSELLRLNPFKFPEGVHVFEHIDRLVEIFNVCWPMYAAMPAVLKDAILQAYKVCGWDLVESKNQYSDELFPTFADLQNELRNVIDDSAYSDELKSNYKGSLETRVRSLTNGLNGQIFSADEIDNERLFDKNVVVDLSRIGSLETKALIMGVLVMRLNEHRVAHSKEMNAPLRHITVLEEAHNLLNRTSTEQNAENPSLAGKSVEMLSNAIAEMRTYGEGFIIADQSPGAVDISAIRNTNTKIIMRLPEETDRRLAGKAAALKDDQLDEIAKLPRGVAVVYQNDWIEPVLCKVGKFDGEEKPYEYSAGEVSVSSDKRKFTSELLKLLLLGRCPELIEADIDLLRRELPSADISTKNKIGVEMLLREYEKTKVLAIWETEYFGALSETVTELLDGAVRVKNLADTATNFDILQNEMERFVRERTEDLSDGAVLELTHALMRNFSEQGELSKEIYSAWYQNLEKGGTIT